MNKSFAIMAARWGVRRYPTSREYTGASSASSAKRHVVIGEGRPIRVKARTMVVVPFRAPYGLKGTR